MFDEEAVGGRWIARLVKLSVVAAAIATLGWWAIQLLGSRTPNSKSPSQQVAILRDEGEKPIPRRVAAESLSGADASIVDELAEELASGDPVGRELAAFALARMEGRAAGAADELLAALGDSELGVRRQAAIALGRVGARPEAAAAALMRRLRAGDVEMLDEIVRALRRLDDEGAGPLRELLADRSVDVRRRAAIELGKMVREGGGDHLDALRGALCDSDGRVRAEAYAALWRCSAIGLDELIAGLHDADPLVRSALCTLLGRMGAEAEPAATELLALAAGDAGSRAAEEALRGLVREGVDLRRRLLPLLDGDDERIAARAARLLGEFGPAGESIRDRLLARAGDLRRNSAAWALHALHDTGLESQLRPPELFDALDADADVHALVLWNPNALPPDSWPPDAGPPDAGPPDPGRRRNRSERIDRGYGVADADLARLAGLRQLKLLDLRENPIGDAGLEHVAELTQLEWLILDRTRITSAGLSHLTGLTRLRRLSLAECEIDDAGLESLASLSSLEFLDLSRTRISDAGIAQIARLARLKSLWLDETAVGDAGLAKLAALANLTELGVRGTRTTESGRAAFATILPEPERRRGARRAPRAPTDDRYQVVGLADWDEPDAAPFLQRAAAR